MDDNARSSRDRAVVMCRYQEPRHLTGRFKFRHPCPGLTGTEGKLPRVEHPGMGEKRSSIQVLERCSRCPRGGINHGSTFKGMSDILPALAKGYAT